MSDFSWSPEDQRDALFTLGYADSRVYATTRIALEYTEAGPLTLEEEAYSGTTHTKVAGIKPIPEALARIFADGVNQLRDTIEHALFVELRRTLDRAAQSSDALPRHVRFGNRGRPCGG